MSTIALLLVWLQSSQDPKKSRNSSFDFSTLEKPWNHALVLKICESLVFYLMWSWKVKLLIKQFLQFNLAKVEHMPICGLVSELVNTVKKVSNNHFR